MDNRDPKDPSSELKRKKAPSIEDDDRAQQTLSVVCLLLRLYVLKPHFIIYEKDEEGVMEKQLVKGKFELSEKEQLAVNFLFSGG